MSVAVDNVGNTLVTGTFFGTVDFGCGPLTVHTTYSWQDPINYSNIFLAKYSPLGVCIWSKSFGNPSAVNVSNVAVDVNGDVIVTGAYGGPTDFGNGTLSPYWAYNDIFVAKYSGADGRYLWAKQFGSSISDDYGYGVAVDKSGNVYVTGYFKGTVSFGGVTPLTSTPGNMSVFVAKYSSSGAHLWSKSFNNSYYAYGWKIAVDHTVNENIVLTGQFSGTIDFGGGPLTSPGTPLSTFVVKLSPSGGYIWAKSFGNSTSDTFGNSIAADSIGDVYVTGQFQNTLDLGGGHVVSSIGAGDIFLFKYLGTNGTCLWSKSFGGSTNDAGQGVAIDANDSDSVIATGYFNGTVDFGGGPLTSSADDIFVAKYSSSGAHRWSKRFGYALGQYGNAVATNGIGDLAVTGYFTGAVDFGGGPFTSNGSFDIFVGNLIP
jgi:hypothetical protein